MRMRWAVSILLALALPIPTRANQVTYRGLVHTSLGTATLTLGGDTLGVSNIGSSGADGVSIALPTPGDHHIDMGPSHIPANGHMAFAAIAGADTLSMGWVSPVNDSMELDLAFQALPGITHYRVQAYLGGVLQRTRDVPVAALPVAGLTTVPVPESNICIRCFFRKVANWFEDHASVTHGSVKIIMPNGEIKSVPTVGVDFNFVVAHGNIGDDPVPVSFDNLVIRPVGQTVNSATRDRVIITAGNHPGFSFRGEAIAPISPMGGPWWSLFGGLALFAIGVGALRFRRIHATKP